MLEVRDLTVSYGQIKVLHGIDLHLNTGEIVALIGPNGAGKTTTLNAIAGLVPHDGRAFLDGDPLPLASHEVVEKGIALVAQGRRVFPSMTVEENLLLGGFRVGAKWKVAEEMFSPIFEYFPRLLERRRQPAGRLSGGEQQMLVIGRAILSQPRVMMIDELSLGLAPKFVELLFEIIVRLNNELKTTFLLVEQAAPTALQISHRAYLLQKGKVAYEGEAKSLAQQVDVLRSAYLGVGPNVPSVVR